MMAAPLARRMWVLFLALAGVTLLNWRLPAQELKARAIFPPAKADRFRFIVFSPDSTTMALGWERKVVKLHDVSSGKVSATIEAEGNVRFVVFSPDGQTLATVSDDTVQLWDTSTGKQRPFIRVKPDRFRSLDAVAFTPDGKSLAMALGGAGLSSEVTLWDLSTGKEKATVWKEQGFFGTRAISPDVKTLALVNYDNDALELWELATGKKKASLKMNEKGVRSLVFSPDGKNLATISSEKGPITLWDATTGKEKTSLNTDISIDNMAFSPDGKRFASAGFGGLKIWEVATGKDVTALEGAGSARDWAAFSPDGKMLASLGCGSTLRLWDLATGRDIAPLPGHIDSVVSLAFSPDGKTLASGSIDQTVLLWDVAKGQAKGTLHGGHKQLAFSRDGKFLATGEGYPPGARLWHADTGKLKAVFKQEKELIFSLAMSDDGKTLAVGGSARADAGTGELKAAISLWDIETGKLKTRLYVPAFGFISSLTFSPDGKNLASGVSSGVVEHRVLLTDVATGKNKGSFQAGALNSAAFSRDGKTLSVVTRGTVMLYDVATSKVKDRSRLDELDPLLWVAFAPNGRTLAALNMDRTVRLFDQATGKQQGILDGLKEVAWCAAFSPDSRTLATGDASGTIKLWDVPSRDEK